MADGLYLNYLLSEETWRSFYEVHYRRDSSLKIRFAYGVVLVALGACGLGGLIENQLLAGALLVTGLFCVLSRQILVLKSVAQSRRHPSFNQRIGVVVNELGIVVEGRDFSYPHAWSDFSECVKTRPGYLFYLDKQSFFFIPQASLTSDDNRRLRQLIEQSGLAFSGESA